MIAALVGIIGSSCASPSPPKAALRSEPITAAQRASPKDAKAPEVKQQTAQGESEQRPRLSLPPAEASLSAIKAVIVPFLPKQEPPSYIAAILGNKDRVWLLSIELVSTCCSVSSLYESDGKRIRLASPAVCAPKDSVLFPHFDDISLKGNSLELLGTSGGGCGSASASALRKGDGTWRCDSEPWERDGIRRFRSSGELISVTLTPYGSDFDFGSTLNGELSPQLAPIAIAKGGVHAWALVGKSDGANLVEWTGMRWRERADALPEGVAAEDILAMTVDDEGTYYAATGTCLLIFDGRHFVAHPVPPGFSPELLVATKAHGLWALGSGRAWHYQPPAWSYAVLPMAHVNSEWLAPNGTLWIAGSSVATQDELFSSRSEPKEVVVVTLALSGMKVGSP